MNLGTLIDDAAARDPQRTALIIDERRVGYGELGEAVRACAAGLAAHGVVAGDRVAVIDTASPLSIAALLGAARLGATATLMNPALTPHELQALLANAGCADTAVAGQAYAERVREATVPTVLTDVELLGELHPEIPLLTDRLDDQPAMVLFTSGTTGLPKTVAIGGRQLAARLVRTSQPFSPDTPPAAVMMCVPYFHVGGALGLLASLYSGNTLVVQRRFDAGEWLRLVAEHRVTGMFLVPTMLHRILEHPDFAATDLSSLAAITYGAAAAPITLMRKAVAALPHVGFTNVFGQTETLGTYAQLLPEDHHDPARAGSVGRPLPGVEVRVVDPTTGADVETGEVGELWVNSPLNTAGGWLRTGDLGRQDPDGYLYPCGRLRDTINRGGEKFGPIEVEEALRSHPAVRDVAVAGIPDEELGQRVGAAVVTRMPVTLDELRSHCRESIAYFKLPERLAIVDDIPYSATGKVDRGRIATLITEHR
ncbi:MULTISPECIES: class I adenylate-forming enzyme family protein [Mycobacterium]|uniref:AMP-dependent ligase n=1 Tax=Mycobacterium kiyosense TaxID=2871094 RepID=A0A9P3UVU2_9MYCO|nr:MULTISPECIES: class I adenylate-forming enzyme family protein [Mycobacterium]BDB42471.1 AMP-dependent ligase [Mycobacterium kiyosense]BDE14266.1 AMP-dependent ligase [Mycobacterium sp. 20KCMC460]GLB81518.1 AMP-dependent ligase [Mycobacterium kiyosense]GLB90115.1 AMP-dependent ligase [Mycobacterium kiyosense]GLB93711.1 AMP-dependent ligase [Mycobacterium kiyosense]